MSRGRTPRHEITRRRRIALIGIAALALALGLIAGAISGGDDEADSPAAASEQVACPAEVAASPARLAGQMLIVRMESTATDSLRRRVAAGDIGGVILFPAEGTDPDALGAEVAKLRRAAQRSAAPAPLVAIDQEGGDVERLPSLPPSRSATAIGAAGPARARAEGQATGTALAGLGIDIDLAPVFDLAGPALGSRAFAADPDEVAELATAFAGGLQDAGVAATAKHFPGLGSASTNTDVEATPIQLTDAQLERELVPFRAAVLAGVDLVMVANATYSPLDPSRPASQSRAVIEGLLRQRLGFEGVVITDDLDAGALSTTGIDEGEAAVGAAGAGADLILTALSEGEAAHAALTQALRTHRLGRDALEASCARTTALRERLSG